MDEYLEEQNAPEAPPKAGTGGAASIGEGELSHAEIAANIFYGGAEPGGGAGAAAAALMEQFDNVDPRWAEVVWQKAKLLFKGKHHFTTHQEVANINFDMDDETTIAVVGDWGGGNQAAQAISDRIKDIKPNHIIHLGDVYYAGTPKEINERFLKFWPTPAEPGKSFALNSNHEMYSGGYGYFDVTLPKFKQPASYFTLSNKNWRLIGLDTGYDEHDLHPPQADWLKAQLADDGRKNILFSHHQLFSAYETGTDCSKLQAKVQPFLNAGKIYGWIWGHEHLCVAYKKFMGLKGVCLGNGCFPYNPPQGKPDNVEWLNTRQQPDDPDYRGIHTFALLKVSPEKIVIQYFDQDGKKGYEQEWS
ncbi:MAG TPA: metallophosphoesterase [Pyrinomonadaceae bacterium]